MIIMWQQILKKDMSYCVCSGKNKTKGFTCKAHCRSKEMKKADPNKKRRKGYFPRKKSPQNFSTAHQALSTWFDNARSRRQRISSKYAPKKITFGNNDRQPKPKREPKPKRQIKPRTLIDNYFEMYSNQGKGQPTLADIKREEGRPLTIEEEQDYYKRIQMKKADPKKGTGKKPKGSARRLYTDENPKDTVPVKFKTKQDVQETFSSSAFKSKSHKRQSQIINLVEQRLRAAVRNAKDPKVKKRLKAAHTYAKQRKEASKQKTKSRSRGAFTR